MELTLSDRTVAAIGREDMVLALAAAGIVVPPEAAMLWAEGRVEFVWDCEDGARAAAGRGPDVFDALFDPEPKAGVVGGACWTPTEAAYGVALLERVAAELADLAEHGELTHWRAESSALRADRKTPCPTDDPGAAYFTPEGALFRVLLREGGGAASAVGGKVEAILRETASKGMAINVQGIPPASPLTFASHPDPVGVAREAADRLRPRSRSGPATPAAVPPRLKAPPSAAVAGLKETVHGPDPRDPPRRGEG